MTDALNTQMNNRGHLVLMHRNTDLETVAARIMEIYGAFRIVSRHIKLSASKLGIGRVNGQVWRRSYSTWLIEAGADPKAEQAEMRHCRASITMEIYAPFVPATQRRGVMQMIDVVTARLASVAVPSTAVT